MPQIVNYQIILSPAKNMRGTVNAINSKPTIPVFIDESKKLLTG